MTTTDSLAGLLVDVGLLDLACKQCCNTIVGFMNWCRTTWFYMFMQLATVWHQSEMLPISKRLICTRVPNAKRRIVR